MPVEIREIVIRAVVSKEQDDDESNNESMGAGSGSAESTEAIIQECVRQVLRILRKEKER